MADDERPTSMGQALESAGFGSDDSSTVTATESDASASDDSSSSTLSTSSDAASTAESPTATSQTAEPPPGPLPYERHKAILDKAYAERDTLKTQMESLAWAQQVPAEVGPRLVEMARRVQGDPVGFLVELASEVQNDPKHAAALKSYAAKVLGTRSPNGNGSTQPQATQPVSLEMPAGARTGIPEVDSVLEARDRYIAEQLGGQFNAILQERVGPLATLAERVAQAEADQQTSAKAQTWATTEFDRMSKRPGFLDHREAIGDRFVAEMQKFPKDEQTEERAAIVLRDVYDEVVRPNLTPSASTVLKTLTAKAVRGSLGASPTTAASASRPKSMADALAQAGL